MKTSENAVTASGNAPKYEPENLKRWTLPKCYVGAEWRDYYSAGVGQSRDSDALERSNFACMLESLGGEHGDNGEGELSVVVVRENHWAVGWVEWIAIHESDTEALKIADEIKGKLDYYPVVNDEHYGQTEMDEANEVWTNCFNTQDRVKYIREHRSQFDFRGFADLLACARGRYFCGYASELIA